MRGKTKKTRYILGTLLLLAAAIAPLFQAQSSYAAQITARKLTLQSVGSVGGSAPGGTVNHKFDFTVPTTGTNIGSIKFEYCDQATGTCNTPTGMDASSVTMGTQAGGATGFTIGNGGDAPAPTANVVHITRLTPATPTGALDLTLNAIDNPTTANYTFYVRITTYSASDGTGAVDDGIVAASTANQIDFTGYMPEALVFCTGVTVDATCTTITTGTVDFGVFSPSSTVTATSEMAAATNAASGYVITVEGATLENGSYSIPTIGTSATAPTIGQSEFGLNLVANTALAEGADVTPAADAGDYTGSASAPYATDGSFAFDDTATSVVASSTGSTAGQVYTATYIVNVAGNQVAGTYTTTLTYICTPTY